MTEYTNEKSLSNQYVDDLVLELSVAPALPDQRLRAAGDHLPQLPNAYHRNMITKYKKR